MKTCFSLLACLFAGMTSSPVAVESTLSYADSAGAIPNLAILIGNNAYAGADFGLSTNLCARTQLVSQRMLHGPRLRTGRCESHSTIRFWLVHRRYQRDNRFPRSSRTAQLGWPISSMRRGILGSKQQNALPVYSGNVNDVGFMTRRRQSWVQCFKIWPWRYSRVALVTTGMPSNAQDNPTDIVNKRQQLMKTMGKSFGPIISSSQR